MAPLTFYTFPLAYNPGKLALLIEEKGLFESGAVVKKNVNLFNGESLSPWFMRISPGSTVPALVLGDGAHAEVLTQTIDQLRYVDDKCGSGPLGGEAVDRKLVSELTDALHAWDGNIFAFANLDKGTSGILSGLEDFRKKVAACQQKKAEAAGDAELAQIYGDKLESMKKSAAHNKDPEAVATNRKELAAMLDRCEGLLEKSKYLAGPEFSVADVLLASVLHRLGTVKQTSEFLKPRPRLSRYFDEQIKTRPSWTKAFPSPLASVSIMLPTIMKVKFCTLTGWYC